MKKTIRPFVTGLLLVVSLPGHAAPAFDCPPPLRQPTPEMLQAAARKARDHGFLWRIAKDGRTSYLYGTIHVGKLDWAAPGPAIKQALQATDTVALELDMLDPVVQRDFAAALANMRATPLPPALTKRMQQMAKRDCVPYENLANVAAEVQILTLTLGVGRRDGLEAAYGTDVVLAGAGHIANKTVVSLETIESQMQLLQGRTPQESEAMVRDGLEQLENGRARRELRHLGKTWSESNFADMSRFDEWCQCRETELERDMMRRMLDERNPKLAERIDALHREGRQVFAAVGSLHMFGAQSLPELMRSRGYAVESVVFAAK